MRRRPRSTGPCCGEQRASYVSSAVRSRVNRQEQGWFRDHSCDDEGASFGRRPSDAPSRIFPRCRSRATNCSATRATSCCRRSAARDRNGCADASALVIGLGGLGSPAALYLAAAGVGRLGVLDFDTVAVHNLQRQVLHDTAAIGAPKTDSARARLEALNPHVRVETWQTTLTRDNARGIIADYDVVLDGTDSFATRYLVNDACVLERRPNVHASIHRFEGQLSVFGARRTVPATAACIPQPPPAGSVPNCAEGGVLGVLPGLLGTLQATEATQAPARDRRRRWSDGCSSWTR